jgi:outer membrane receptor protein involved in Fe transport
VALTLGLAWSAQPVQAQAVYGSIAGTIVDQQSAVVPGVSVTILSRERQLTDTVVTNASGFYRKGQLLPGLYEVRAELAGFKVGVVAEVFVNVDTETKVDVTLELGEMTEVITVASTESQLLKTDRADVATTLDSKQLTELPVLDRNFTKFVLLTPGTSRLGWNHATSENPQQSIQTMVNGQHFSGTGFQLDGTENRDPILGIIVINPNLEAIGESKVTSQNYAAQFGQATAGVVSVQTKSGTNDIHGSAFFFSKTDSLQARNPFTQPPDQDLPETDRKQFGGSLGGPLQKNKWFFFADYQGVRDQKGGSILTTVPTARARTGDLSEYTADIFDPLSGATPDSRTQFPGNVIPPGRVSPQTQALLALIPMPNNPGTDNGTRDNFIASGTETLNSDAFDVRLDGRLSNRANIFARYSYIKFTKDSPTAFGDVAGGGAFDNINFGGFSNVKNQSVAVGLDLSLSDTSILDVRIGFFQYKVNVLPRDFGTSPATDAGIPGLNFDDFSSGMPYFNVFGNQGDFEMGYSLGANQCNCPLDQNEKQAQIAVNYTKLSGNHTFKVGADIRRAYNLRVPSDRHRAGELDFSSNRTIGPTGGGLGFATFLLGDVTRFTRYTSPNTNARERQWRHFYYVQDTYRPGPKVTLNLGLRLSIINPETVNEPGNGGWPDQTTGQVLVGGIGDVNLAGNVENSLNWEPRFGLTYQVNEKTVIRAGYGRSHDIGVFGTTFGHAVTQNLPVLSIQEDNAPANFERVFNLADGPSAPVFIQPDETGRFPLPNGVGMFVRPQKMTLPRVDSWNVTAQRQLSEKVSFEIGYVGNRGSQTFAGDGPDLNNNQPTIVGFPDVPLNQRRPFFAQFGWTQDFRQFETTAHNSYNSLQAKIVRRYSNGWSLLAHYTLGVAKQFDGQYYNIDRDVNWGRAGWDRLHQAVIAATWELPIARGDPILGGWQLNSNFTFASGVPFNIEYRDAGQDRDTGPNRPNITGDAGIGSGDGRDSPYFNVTPIGSSGSAFTRPAVATFGDLERNRFSGPSFWNVDASLFKRFGVGERADVELRVEVENLFNHVNLGNPDSTIGVPGNDNPNAGFINGVGQNHVQRSFQFGARVTF